MSWATTTCDARTVLPVMIVCVIMVLWMCLADLEDPVEAPSAHIGTEERLREQASTPAGRKSSSSEEEDEEDEDEEEVEVVLPKGFRPRRRSVRDRS
jgi:hypothetical protein